ncbi:hypothetical protein ACSBR2_040506 [Camellia fascicularis]
MKHGKRGFIDSLTICLQWFLYCSLGGNGSNPTMAVAATTAGDQQLQQTANVSEKEKEKEKENETSITSNDNDNDIGNGSGKESPYLHEESDLPESLEHNLPDCPFASPKAAVDFFDDKEFLWLIFFNLTTIVTLKVQYFEVLYNCELEVLEAVIELLMPSTSLACL